MVLTNEIFDVSSILSFEEIDEILRLNPIQMPTDEMIRESFEKLLKKLKLQTNFGDYTNE